MVDRIFLIDIKTKNMYFEVIMVAIIFNKNNEILTVKRNRKPGIGKRALPGGRDGFDINPDPQEAIKHEVYCDFGVNLIKHSLINIKYIDLKTPRLLFYYKGQLDGDPQIISPDTTSEIKRLSLKEIQDIELAYDKTDKEMISEIIQ